MRPLLLATTHAVAAAMSLALSPIGATAAGTVDVRFKPVTELADAGRDRFESERNLEQLGAHFRALAARLPDGQALRVEVTDLDLAGDMRPLRRGGEVRVLSGRADWPSLALRWTLSADGRTLAEGDERIADLSYLMHPLRGRVDQPLAHEMRLIDRWFDERVRAAAAR